jgi:hypothetical protein
MPTWKKCLKAILDNNLFSIIMAVITVYALFGDDIRVLGFTKDDDEAFWIINSAAMGLFALELILASLV